MAYVHELQVYKKEKGKKKNKLCLESVLWKNNSFLSELPLHVDKTNTYSQLQ
jgi:hypothetical protein